MVAPFLVFAAIFQPAIALHIEPAKRQFLATDNVIIEVAAENRTPQEITIVRMLDGMERGLRGPHGRFEIRTQGGKWAPLKFNVGYCGNTNPLTDGDFVVLRKGARAPLVSNMNWMPETKHSQLGEPGKYEVRFVYDTTVPFEQWIGGPVPEPEHARLKAKFQDRYGRVPKGVFVSNVVLIEVVASPASSGALP